VADIKLATYPSTTTLSHSLASLATSSTLVAGQESGEIDNTTNKYTDGELGGTVTPGTTVTAGSRIEIWGVPVNPNGTYPGVLDGTDSAETLTARTVELSSASRLLAVIDVDTTTANRTYNWRTTVKTHFKVHPSKMVLFTTHNTGSNLNATAGNHTSYYRGSYKTI
jgi:hypothetical protein